MKKASFATYEALLHTHVLPAFGDATSISEGDLQDFVLEKLDMGYGLSTVQQIVLVARMVLRYGAALGLCEKPDWCIRYPARHAGRPLKLFSLEDQRLILRVVLEKPTPRAFGIYLALASGMRIGELCALRWADIDVRAGVIRVQRTLSRVCRPGRAGLGTEIIIGTPKTPSSSRDIPISDDLQAIIPSMASGRKEDDFVLTGSSKPTEPRAYRNYFNSFQDQLGIPRRNFHALRHSFATRCIEAGFDAKTVSVLLGHSSINTTLDLYVHPGFDKKKACVNSIQLTL